MRDIDLNMIGQQRHILATLGIDLWIPRTVISQKSNAPSLWRDQALQVESTVLETEPAVLSFEEAAVAEPKPIEIQPLAKTLDLQPEQKAEIVIPPERVGDITISIPAFEVQAYSLDSCVIIVDTTNLNDDQKQLWLNIQKAKLGQYAELKWPFPLAVFQDGRGVGSYLQGFLDGLAFEKKILCLGEFVYMQHANMIQLASLQDMLEQPILKKRLWQLMQDEKQ